MSPGPRPYRRGSAIATHGGVSAVGSGLHGPVALLLPSPPSPAAPGRGDVRDGRCPRHRGRAALRRGLAITIVLPASLLAYWCGLDFGRGEECLGRGGTRWRGGCGRLRYPVARRFVRTPAGGPSRVGTESRWKPGENSTRLLLALRFDQTAGWRLHSSVKTRPPGWGRRRCSIPDGRPRGLQSRLGGAGQGRRPVRIGRCSATDPSVEGRPVRPGSDAGPNGERTRSRNSTW